MPSHFTPPRTTGPMLLSIAYSSNYCGSTCVLSMVKSKHGYQVFDKIYKFSKKNKESIKIIYIISSAFHKFFFYTTNLNSQTIVQ